VRYRSTLLYLLAAIVLVAFYLYETRKEEKEQDAKEEAKVIFPVKVDHLQSLTLKREEETIRLEKPSVGSDWSIVAPTRAAVDKITLSRLQRTLAELKYERLISEKATDLSEFGLDKPSLVISFRGETEEETLSLGAQSPMGASFYASVSKTGKVYLLSGAQKQELDKSLYDLREKKLLTLEMDKVTNVMIDRKQSRWHLYKKEGRWHLEGDGELKVDQRKVEVFVRPILWADALSFEKETAEDIKTYGLHEPAARIVLSDDTKTEEIVFGDPVKDTGESSLYAMVKGKTQIVTVRKRLLADIPTEKEKIREGEESKKEGSN
jgi:Domain of unknown function (DUF4340)